MNRNSYYAVIGTISILAAALGIYLVPNEKEFSLMYFYDKQFSQAFAGYQKLYDEGDHTISVAMPLVWINLEFANTEDAIDLMQTFVGKNPDNLDAFVFLGGLYKDADRPYDYLKNLTNVYRLAPSVDVLRQQANLYLHFGEVSNAIAMLQQIIDKYTATEEYRDLAFLYAREGKFAEALTAAEEMLNRFPVPTLQSSSVRIAIGLLSDEGQDDFALQLAKDYIAVNRNVKTALDIVYVFVDRGLFEAALQTLQVLPLAEQANPDVIITKSGVLGSLNLENEHFSYLMDLLQKGKLPSTLIPSIVQLALYNDTDPGQLAQVLNKVDIQGIGRDLLVRIAEKAALGPDPESAKILEKRLGKKQLQADPLLAVLLSFTRPVNDEKQERLLAKLHRYHQFNDDEVALLARVYQQKGYKDLAKTLLTKLDSLEKIDDQALYELANVYVDLEMTEEGLELFEELRSHDLPKDSEVDEAWLLLSTVKGDDQAVREFLETDDSVENDVLLQLFSAAIEHRENNLAQEIAEKLVNRDDNPVNRLLYAFARAAGGDDQVLSEIRSLLEGEVALSNVALSALSAAAKTQQELRGPLLSIARKQLKKPGLTVQETRTLGYMLADNEFKPEAAEVFFELAKEKTIESPDMRALLDLWGEHLGPDELAFIARKAEQEDKAHKGKWLQHLVQARHPETVFELVDDEELDDELIIDAYIGAAAGIGDKNKVAYAVTRIPPEEYNLPRLHHLGKMVFDAGMNDEAELFYLRILAEDPMDELALRQMGIAEYNKGALCCAYQYFQRYCELYPPDYWINFYCGSIWLEKGHRKMAKPYFCCARSQLERLDGPDRSQRLLLAQIYTKLQRGDWAVPIYRWLLLDTPNDLFLRAEYANLLLDRQYYGSAAAVLWRCDFLLADDPKGRYAILMARARWFRETGRLPLAERLLCCLHHEHPEDAAPLTSLADVEFVWGRWRRSLSAINRAQCLQPANESLCKVKQGILSDHNPFIAGNHEYRKTGFNQREHFNRAFGKTYIHDYTYLEGRAEWDIIHVNGFVNKQGIVEDVTAYVPRGYLAIGHDFCSGLHAKGTLFMGETNFGLGAESSYPDMSGQWLALGWLNAPCWDFTQTTIENGTQDKVLVGRRQHVRAWLDASLTLALNRYNLPGITNAASSWQAEGLVTWTPFPHRNTDFIIGEEGVFTVNYALDKELRTSMLTLLNPSGIPYNPIPLLSRENHIFYLYYQAQFCKNVLIQSYGGYLYDADAGGKAHPVGGISVLLGDKDSLQLRFDYNHSQSSQDSEETVDSYLFELRKVF